MAETSKSEKSPAEGNEEVFRILSLAEYTTEKVDEVFTENIPIETAKELPTSYRYVVGLISYAVMLAAFIYFVASSYHTARHSPFVSITTGGLECNEVTRPLTGTFLASNQGLWEGDAGFSFNQAFYQFSFSNLELTLPEFSSGLQGLEKFIQATYSPLARSQSAAVNVAMLMTVSFVSTTDTSNQLITFTTNPGYVFDRDTYYITASTAQGLCFAPSSTTLDTPTATFTVSYNAQQFITQCPTTLNPDNMGYSYYNSMFSLSFDMRSFIVAFSVNMGFIGLSDLEVVQLSPSFQAAVALTVNGVAYTGQQMYSTLYPGMTPIFCVLRASDNSLLLCSLRIAGTFLLPVLNNVGGSSALYNITPQYCNCSTSVGQSDSCDLFQFMASMILSTNTNYTAALNTLPDLINLVSSYLTTYNNDRYAAYSALNVDAYVAQYLSTIYSTDVSQFGPAFAFCGFNCSMITVYSGDPYSQYTTEYYYQLNNASCSDSMLYVTNWEALSNDPPTTLIESYYSCLNDARIDLFNAIGISLGNTSLATSVFAILMMPVIYLMLKLTDYVPPYKEYDKEMKQDVLEELALHILRARDGKTRGMKQNGPLITLTKDLVHSAKTTGGYPDSDDEDSDEEEGEGEGDEEGGKGAAEAASEGKGKGKTQQKADAKPSSTATVYFGSKKFIRRSITSTSQAAGDKSRSSASKNPISQNIEMKAKNKR